MPENITSPVPSGSDFARGDSSTGDLAGAQVGTPQAGGVSPTVPTKKSPILLFIALALLSIVSVLAIYLFLQVRTLTLEQTSPSPTPTPVASIKPIETMNQELVPIITTPITKSTIKSPVTIKGSVPSGWMFEGQFPIEIRSVEGKLLGTGIAKEVTPGEWSSDQDVDFTATITFDAIGKSGTIILLSDNPSGDPKNQKTYQCGVFFK